MLEFKIGDEVFFQSYSGVTEGIIVKYNKKTVSIVTRGGQRWTVTPSLLTRKKEVTEGMIIEHDQVQTDRR